MKYVLKWSGRKDSKLVQLAFAYCKKEIPICRDTCEFVSYERYSKMVADGIIEPPTKHWKIEPGEVGMVCDASYATSYIQNWENLSHCYHNFIAGYEACEKELKYLRDWDEAIKHEAERTAYLKKKKRTVKFESNNYNLRYNDITYQSPHKYNIEIVDTRNNKRFITISSSCTGPEFEELVFRLCTDCWLSFPTLTNPLNVENHVSSLLTEYPIKKATKVAKH